MSVETKEQILEKLDRSRQQLIQTSYPSITESLRAYIEELEGKLLLLMGQGPE